jgi:hypothetical protein
MSAPQSTSGTEPQLQQLSMIVREWWKQFLVAYTEYGPGAADETGLAGQWGDLHRKVKKLKPFMWEGDETRLKRENPREVLMDLIGHCFLAIEMLDREMPSGRSSVYSAPPSSSATDYSASLQDWFRRCCDDECVDYRRMLTPGQRHVHRYRPIQ